jgi:hypothetical protein
MKLNITQLNQEPYTLESIIQGFVPIDHFVFCTKGFRQIIHAAKNYHIIDTILNDGVYDRKTTVELILNQSNKGINDYTHKVTKEFIAECMTTFTPVIDKYAEKLKNADSHVTLFNIQQICFHIVLYDILGYDGMWRTCFPCTYISQLIQHEMSIISIIKDVLVYMISMRAEFQTIHIGKIYKAYPCVVLSHNLLDKNVKQIWDSRVV